MCISTLETQQPMHTVSFDWFLSGLEWILKFLTFDYYNFWLI